LRKEPPPDFMVLEPEDFAMAPGTSKIVMYGPIPALLLQTPGPGSELRVFVATCTHFDCTVSYRPEKKAIFCACHEGYYDLEGRVTAGPPPRPLDRFHWERKGDRLAIALDKDKLTEAWAEPEEAGK
jgi:Rieske Fe-S protein